MRVRGTPEHTSWRAMRNRCLTTTHEKYPMYGGRGITICPRWDSFAEFLADMGPRPVGTTIERIDNNGNYEPSNCRWATVQEQARNRRTTHIVEMDGRSQCLKDWCDELKCEFKMVQYFMRKHGLSALDALKKEAFRSQPKRSGKPKPHAEVCS